MNKQLCTIFLLTLALQLPALASNANANACASAPASLAADAENKSIVAATQATPADRKTLYAEQATAYAEKIKVAENDILQEILRMGKRTTPEEWQRRNLLHMESYQHVDELLADVLTSGSPLKKLKQLWYAKHPHHIAEKREALRSSSPDKAKDLNTFTRVYLFLQPKPMRGAHGNQAFYDFLSQSDNSIVEPEFVSPDSPEGKRAAETLAQFDVHGTRLLIDQGPDEPNMLVRSRHLMLVQPAFLSTQSPYKHLLAAALAHEAHHIIFADVHYSTAIASCLVELGVQPYGMQQFQDYKRLQELRAETLAALKAETYLRGLLQFARMRKATGAKASGSHIPYDERETLLLAIQKQLAPQEKIAAPIATKSLVHTCNACAKQGEKFQRCGRCKKVYYCGKDCQVKDWPTHKTTCP